MQSSTESVITRLLKFHHMPGSVWMQEACIRDEHTPICGVQVFHAVSLLQQPLIMSSKGMASPPMLLACISLAASIGKLMHNLEVEVEWKPLQQQEEDKEEEQQGKEAKGDEAANKMEEEEDSQHSGPLNTLQHQLRSTITALDTLAIPACSRTTQHHRHKLQTVLLVTLVQVTHMCVSEDAGGEGICLLTRKKMVKSELRGLGELGRGLSSILAALLQGDLPAWSRPWARVGLVWEQYALKHFNGRLLPGCCHLGCTNLDGVSEAALKTLLCSGCRRARYCSTECQRAAWIEGGHSILCGK